MTLGPGIDPGPPQYAFQELALDNGSVVPIAGVAAAAPEPRAFEAFRENVLAVRAGLRGFVGDVAGRGRA